MPWTEVVVSCAEYKVSSAEFPDRFDHEDGGGSREMVVGVFR